MGTKKDLVLPVAAAVSAAAPGIFLDAFSGMCSVGEEVASERQVWCNDAQVFASEVATALFASQGGPMNSLCASELLFPHVSSHQASIGVVVKEALLEEAAFEDSECYTVGIGRSQTFHAQCRFWRPKNREPAKHSFHKNLLWFVRRSTPSAGDRFSHFRNSKMCSGWSPRAGPRTMAHDCTWAGNSEKRDDHWSLCAVYCLQGKYSSPVSFSAATQHMGRIFSVHRYAFDDQ